MAALDTAATDRSWIGGAKPVLRRTISFVDENQGRGKGGLHAFYRTPLRRTMIRTD